MTTAEATSVERPLEYWSKSMASNDDPIHLLEAEVRRLKILNEGLRADAEKYRKLVKQADDTADYCIDQATNEDGIVVRRNVDPGLGGDEFIMVRRRRNDFVVELKETVMVVRKTGI